MNRFEGPTHSSALISDFRMKDVKVMIDTVERDLAAFCRLQEYTSVGGCREARSSGELKSKTCVVQEGELER